MLKVTKIFRFEMAHAIHGYQGKCKDIHGHSYQLHVTVAPVTIDDNMLGETGLVIDFKELKSIVNENIIQKLDHGLILSNEFIKLHNPGTTANLVTWDYEPSAENLVLYIKQVLVSSLPNDVRLVRLVLFETNDSYVEWEPGPTFQPPQGSIEVPPVQIFK